MDKFTSLTSVAAPLPMINVDTDMIIPKQFLKTIKRTGLGKSLFYEMRFDDEGKESPDFVLNKPAYRNAKILVAGDNFGCGMPRACTLGASRLRHSLRDFDVVRRHLLQQLLQERHSARCFLADDLAKLMDDAERGANATLTVDLEKQEVRGPDGGVVRFDIDPFRKKCLMEGLDDIGLTMQKADKIDAFEETTSLSRPWA